jgi:hypothetical protein
LNLRLRGESLMVGYINTDGVVNISGSPDAYDFIRRGYVSSAAARLATEARS